MNIQPELETGTGGDLDNPTIPQLHRVAQALF
jgi:hypothetical protein